MSLLPVDNMIKLVEGHDDLVQFRYDFVLDGKALEDGGTEPTVTVDDESGDLLIDGYAAVWEGNDRQGENFAPGAFARGIKAFLDGQAGLCYHHKHDKLLGKVLDLREEEGKGLRMKARVDGAIRSHPELKTYYEQIKNGSLRALSVGGFFKRALTEAGRRIVDMDFTEISVTPVPVHSGTSFAVVAGKALTADISIPEVPGDLEDEIRDEDFRQITWICEELDGIFTRITEGVKQRKDTTEAVAA